jgi:hypothetical protein
MRIHQKIYNIGPLLNLRISREKTLGVYMFRDTDFGLIPLTIKKVLGL